MSLARQSHSKSGAPWQHLKYHPYLHQSSKEIKIVRLNKLSRAAKKKNKKKKNLSKGLILGRNVNGRRDLLLNNACLGHNSTESNV
jgi:hypothetical protein